MEYRSCCWSSNSWNRLRLWLGQCILYVNGCGCHRSSRMFLLPFLTINLLKSIRKTKVFSAFSYFLDWSNTRLNDSASDDGRCALRESVWPNCCVPRADGQRSRPRHYLTFSFVFSYFVLNQKESS